MDRDKMTYDEAVDFFSYNTAGVGGENFPVIHFEFRWGINETERLHQTSFMAEK